MEPPDSGVILGDYHLLIGKEIKRYLHQLGIHSSTVQIEYLKTGTEREEVALSVKDPDCYVNSYCLNDNNEPLDNCSTNVMNSNTL